MTLPPRAERFLLGAILLLALGVRLWGIDFGLPHSFRYNETAIVRRALAFGTGDLNPHSFHWPAFHMYVLFVLYGALFVAGKLAGVFASPADYRNLYLSDPTLFLLSGRLLTAALGTATVYVVYRIARRFGGGVAGLLAALCLALTYYHVRDSHLVTLDVPAAFWSALVLAAATGIFFAAAPSRPLYVAAGIAIGLAAATKYNAGIVLLAAVAAHVLRRPIPPLTYLVTAGIVAAVAFAAATPFNWIDGSAFLRDFRFQQQHIAEGQWGLATVPAWRSYLGGLCTADLMNASTRPFDPMGLVLVGGAIGTIATRPAREAALLLVVPVAYFAYVGRWGMAATRYLEPILPLLAVTVGVSAARLGPRSLALLGLAFLVSLRTVLVSDLILSRTDTRIEAKEWIEANLSPSAKVALESYGPPLDPSREFWERRIRRLESGEIRHPTQSPERMAQFYEWQKENSPQTGYDIVKLNDTLLDADDAEGNRIPSTNYDVSRLRRLEVRYVIVSSYQYARFRTERAQTLYPGIVEFYDTLERRFPLVREFRPDRWQPGPVIRIYALDSRT